MMRCIMNGMILYETDSLFAWDRMEDSPSLKVIRDFFKKLPDGRLLESLSEQRGKGRNDYPVRVLWFCALLQPLLRHPTMRLTLEDLERNADLRRKGDSERLLEGAGIKNIVYDEAGTISCYDMTTETPVRHEMAYIGHEAKRGTLKYRCPARHRGWTCPYDDQCNKGKSYGMTVRVKQSLDLRRFPPIPRATKTFERLYKGRTANERVNARLKIFWGADDGNVAGGTNFLASVGIVMLVHIGMATLLAASPRRRAGTLGQVRLSGVAKALAESR